MQHRPHHADWTDNSGRLPGIGGIGSAILIGAIAGGSAVLLLRVYNRSPVRAVPSSLDLEGASADGSISLHNRGKRPVNVLSLSLPPDSPFSLQPLAVDLPALLHPDQRLSIDVRFAPQSTGKFSDELSVTMRDASDKVGRLRVKVKGTARAWEAAAVAAR